MLLANMKQNFLNDIGKKSDLVEDLIS